MSIETLSKYNILNFKHNHFDSGTIKFFGFWIYLMSDCILFATLFTTYAVLNNNVADGPCGKDIFSLLFVLVETFFLLFSGISYGMIICFINKNNMLWVIIWLIVTFLFGLSFICMEIYEFYYLISKNYGPYRSAFLSSYFTLIATHGIHIIAGLIWIIVMVISTLCNGLSLTNRISFQCLSLFWHFLDIIWICIFTVVYLVGAL